MVFPHPTATFWELTLATNGRTLRAMTYLTNPAAHPLPGEFAHTGVPDSPTPSNPAKHQTVADLSVLPCDSTMETYIWHSGAAASEGSHEQLRAEATDARKHHSGTPEPSFLSPSSRLYTKGVRLSIQRPACMPAPASSGASGLSVTPIAGRWMIRTSTLILRGLWGVLVLWSVEDAAL